MNPSNPAHRRYMSQLIPLMVAYVAAIFGVAFLFGSAAPPTGPLAYALSLLPALPVLGVIWAMGRYLVEETDEYLRARQVRAILWATGITLALCTVWGFLQAFDMAPAVPLFWVFVVFCAGLGVSRCIDGLVPAPR